MNLNRGSHRRRAATQEREGILLVSTREVQLTPEVSVHVCVPVWGCLSLCPSVASWCPFLRSSFKGADKRPFL